MVVAESPTSGQTFLSGALNEAREIPNSLTNNLPSSRLVKRNRDFRLKSQTAAKRVTKILNLTCIF